MQSSDRTPARPARGRSVFSRFAIPHSFGPDLGVGEAFLAIGCSLARIFGGVILFALWGGCCAFVWSASKSHLWRTAMLVPLVMLLAGAMTGFMLLVGAFEKRLQPRPRRAEQARLTESGGSHKIR